MHAFQYVIVCETKTHCFHLTHLGSTSKKKKLTKTRIQMKILMMKEK